MPKSTPSKKSKALRRQVEISRILTVPSGIGGPIIADQQRVVLPFAYRVGLFNDATTAWTVGTALNVRINNAFSPINATHQPYGFDQMATLYRFYKVENCYMRFTVANMSTTPCYFFVREVPVNENFSMTAGEAALITEKPNVRSYHVPALGGPVVKHEVNIDIPKVLGVTRQMFEADVSEYSALCTAAPNRYAYVQVGVAGSANTSYCEVMVEVGYTVKFWQRITQGQS